MESIIRFVLIAIAYRAISVIAVRVVADLVQ
jgi:hypothetical protein